MFEPAFRVWGFLGGGVITDLTRVCCNPPLSEGELAESHYFSEIKVGRDREFTRVITRVPGTVRARVKTLPSPS
jgi:hypothetical protein